MRDHGQSDKQGESKIPSPSLRGYDKQHVAIALYLPWGYQAEKLLPVVDQPCWIRLSGPGPICLKNALPSIPMQIKMASTWTKSVLKMHDG